MVVKYKKIIDLNILHNYYVEGKSTDFSIVPTTETLKLLNGYRLKLKNTPTGIVILHESQNELPTIPIDGDLRLTFEIKCNNNAIFIFSDLEDLSNNSAVYFFENNNNLDPLVLTNTQTELYGDLITYSFSLDQDSSRIEIKNKYNDTVVWDETISPVTEEPEGVFNYSHQIKLNGFDPGKYLIVHYSGLTNEDLEGSSEVYINPSLARSKPFGIIELLEDEFSITEAYTTVLEYKIEFERKATELSFRLKLSNEYPDDSFYIEDAGVVQNGTPYTTLNRLKGVVDEIDSKLMYFKVDETDEPVNLPFFENPKVGLELVKYNLAEERKVIINNLPNPSTKSSNSTIFLSI